MDASPKGAVELFHGYTYSGIPVSVAAALAVQSIIESSQMIPFVIEIWHNVDDMLISAEDISMKYTKLNENFTQFQHAVNVGTSRDILLLVISGQNV